MSDNKDKLDTTITKPTNVVNFSLEATASADYVKCSIDYSLSLCTLLFFKKHFVPKMTEKGLMIDQTVDQAFLEVKVPTNAVMALTKYLDLLFKEMAKNPNQTGVSFGPSRIKLSKE